MEFHVQTQFRLEVPTGRIGYRIRYKSPDTHEKWKTLSLPEVKKANQLYREGIVDADQTRAILKAVLREQYAIRDKKKIKSPFLPKNIRLVEKMWEEKYTRQRKRGMKKPGESYRELILAAEAAGMHPLDTCNLESLEDYLEESLRQVPEKLCRRITWINSILVWLGRPRIPQYHVQVRRKVKYLSEDEFLSILEYIKRPEDQRLARIAFYTGLLLGEIFYLQSHHIQSDNLLAVEGQMTDKRLLDGSFESGAIRTERAIWYPDVIERDLKEWTAMSWGSRYEIRLRSFAKVIKSACVQAFGSVNEVKLLNFQCLRHCHAIWLLQNGASIHEVAQQLGNHFEVTNRYYSEYELREGVALRLRKRFV